MEKTAKVMIGIPSRNNSWYGEFGISLASMCTATAMNAPNISLILNCAVGTGLCANRIDLCKSAIKHGCSHLLFLDDDMKIPMDTLGRLLSHGLPIVAANCVRKELPPRSTAKAFDERGSCVWTTKDSNGIEEVKSVGTGIMLIETGVFKKLPEPWFCEDPVKQLGEDIFFCNLARAHGYKIFIDHDISKRVSHMGTFEFTHMLTDQWDTSKEKIAS